MELNTQIRKYRMILNLSQDELADKIYVTRQTISNWETGKNYPDVHSLLLLSALYKITLDQLLKGDLEMMKEEIKKEDIKTINFYSYIYAGLFIVLMLSAAPLVYYFERDGLGMLLIIAIITFYFELKVNKLKKENNIQTYKEILAFTNGKRLDEIASIKEEAKKPYQKFMMVIASGIFAVIAFFVLLKILETIK